MIRRAAFFLAIITVATMTVPLLGSPAPGAPAKISAGRVHKSFQPNNGKIFVLVIGNDARAGNPDSARADAVHIVGLNAKTMKGGILNFPRDSWVTIPGRGSARINEAIQQGGPPLLAKTLENMTGIRLDYWVMTGFEGFRRIIKTIGKVEINIPRPMHDPYGSGANLPAGRRALSSEPSLAFVRTRKILPGGDVARTTNQGRFLLALLRKLRGDVARNPGALFKWMTATRGNTRLNVSNAELFRLGVLAAQVKSKDVDNVTVPVSVGSVGGASVVFISPHARAIYARFKATGRL